MNIDFDNTLKAGDVLTSITIVISVIALVISLAKDRSTKISEQAARVRAAAASTLSKLDRWQQVQLSLYQDLQPSFVELSEALALRYDVVRIRDQFWKSVGKARSRVARQTLDEQLTTSYGDLISHFPLARRRIADALASLDKIEIEVSERFLDDGERGILELSGQCATYQTPLLGNHLRRSAASGAALLKYDSDQVLDPVREYLFSLILLSDNELVNSAGASEKQ
ncbi:hypothetical protein [Roseateles noduli]|uniref:hypothetical protein n=1 Tax=Roseateles noduli TaxID=2052484 RepID=UPI003D65168B